MIRWAVARIRRQCAALVHSPEFLKLWAGQTISLFGSEITQLALPLTAAVTLQATAFQMGLLGAAQSAPWLLVGLVAGAWVDRMRRRPTLIAADVGRALAVATIPAAALLGVLRVEYLYVAAFVVGLLTVFFEVAYQSLLPVLVGREHLVGSNSRLEFSLSLAQISGPGLAGLLIQAITAPLTIVLDALSFLASAASLRLIRTPEPSPLARRRSGLGREIVEGLRVLVRNPLTRTTTICTGIANLFGNIQYSIYVLYMVRDVGLQPALIGLIFGAGGVGVLLGASFAAPTGRRFGSGPTIVMARVAIAVGLLIAPFVLASPMAFSLLALGRLLFGFGVTMYNIHQTSLRQAVTPDHLQGRINATFRFIVRGALPVGLFVGGVLGEIIGLRATLVVGAFGGVIALLVIALSPIPRLRELPAVEPPPASEEAPSGTA